MIGYRELYVENNPLIWIGTDVFLKKRGKRLGKKIIDKALFIQLIERFERDRIRNFHYWISSDYLSSWEEFVEEFIFIYELKKRFKMFSILAHAPFLIPYSTTPLFKLLDLSADHKNQIKYKQVLKSTQHVETKYLYLNQLLNNEKMDNGDGFFDFLNRNDFPNTFKTMYNFLKRERISLESSSIKSVTGIFKKLEKKIEGIVSELI